MNEFAIGLWIFVTITYFSLHVAFVLAEAKGPVNVKAHLSEADRDLLQKLVSRLENESKEREIYQTSVDTLVDSLVASHQDFQKAAGDVLGHFRSNDQGA